MMNRHTIAAAVATLALCLQAGIVSAQTDVLMPGGHPTPTEQTVTNGLNRLGVSVRLGVNIDAHFRSTGAATLHPLGRHTPHGDNYNYDDGYVLTDSSGSAGGLTWYWGYDSASQIVGNTAELHRHTVAASTGYTSGGVDSSDMNLGLEVTYNRELGRKGKLQYGLEAAVNYLNISFDNSHAVPGGDATLTTDTYYPTPGTTIPGSPPYTGQYTGPNFVISNTPFSSVTTVIPGGTTVLNRHEFNADVWGIRVGPYLEYPLTTNINASISGGFAFGLVDDSASWSQTVVLPGGGAIGASGGGNRFDFMWGFYGRANLSWEFSENWMLIGGAQYQDIGQLHHRYGTQIMDLDLSRSIFFTGGVSYRF